MSPKQIVPRLADAGIYLASESTIYRLRREQEQQDPRRRIARTDRVRAKTVHQATRPNKVWSWGITYLPTTVRGRYLYLYLVLDVWSRRIVGWQVHESENSDDAAALIHQICSAEGINPRGLVLHSDDGTPMRGNTMRSTLQWLGIVPSFSRPHVCDDNPCSEALFRTLKQAPAYPSVPFHDLLEARRWVAGFVGNGDAQSSSYCPDFKCSMNSRATTTLTKLGRPALEGNGREAARPRKLGRHALVGR